LHWKIGIARSEALPDVVRLRDSVMAGGEIVFVEATASDILRLRLG
jgi:hypothetical protein